MNNYAKKYKKAQYMKREELAELLNVSRNTLANWEKDKPELVRLINQGFALDESIEATERHLENLKAIKAKASSGKFKLK
ncbi:helix-turn-helix domain-containing protein [Sulfurimonas sp.]|uniref:helix-turn-helix domain-containing protein n=1 Tax=Sulfurimonas sp. TaxID=2022749 RepID=UPI0035664597